jgi:hypothetical protein
MEQATEVKPSNLNLEDSSMEMEPFQMEMSQIEDPSKYEESSRKLHEISFAIEEEIKKTRMTVNKLFKNVGQEKGLNKLTRLFGHIGEYFKSQSDESTMESSTRFLKKSLLAIDEYKRQIPVHIQSFRTAHTRLGELKKQCIARFKEKQAELKVKKAEHEKLKGMIEKEAVFEKKEELKVREQEIAMQMQDLDFKLRRYETDLKKAGITMDLYKVLKGEYELLLTQTNDLVTALQSHLGNLEVISPAMATIQNVVQMIDKFSQGVEAQRKKDNEVLRLVSAALKPINGTIKDIDNPWVNEETIRIKRKNLEEGREDYKKKFGPNIASLEDYDIEKSVKRVKKNV